MDLNRTTWSCRFLSHKLIGWGPVHETTFAAPRPRVICGLALFVAVQLLIRVRLFATPRTAACQTSLSFPISQSLLKLMSIDSVMVGCFHPTISSSVVPFPSCLQYFPASMCFPMGWLFTSGGQNIGASASISVLPVNIQLISFRSDWFELLAVQGALMCLLQHHRSKASVLQCSAFFMVQLWHLYVTTRKTVTLSIGTFVNKVMSLLPDTLSRFGVVFFPWASVF